MCLVNDEIVEESSHLLVDVLGRFVAAKLAGELPKRFAAAFFLTFHLPLGEFRGVEEDASLVHLFGPTLGAAHTTFSHRGPHGVRRWPLGSEFGTVSGDDVPGRLPLLGTIELRQLLPFLDLEYAGVR